MLIFILIIGTNAQARQLTVCLSGDCDYDNISRAGRDAAAGDTILIREGVYSGGIYIENWEAAPENPFVIRSEEGFSATISGGNSGIHFVNCEGVVMENIHFVGQLSNGVNIDDGGDYSDPAEHFTIKKCVWFGMDADDNNDELKLSGLDNFRIVDCEFYSGADGGSLIDMVGCHDGVIEGCVFIGGGSNCIQAKGGCNRLVYRRNWFERGGHRSLNIGGSTGFQYFRPLGESFEAAYIEAHSNVFIGSTAPIGFVGAVHSSVFNNTIILPDKWAIRILQETVAEGILSCSHNEFANNIVYIDSRAAFPTLNIGANTEPETFSFFNNLWYNVDDENWSGPNLPTEETSGILNENPLFVDYEEYDFHLAEGSPAIGAGCALETAINDFDGREFANPRSIGAFEYDSPFSIQTRAYSTDNLQIYPNPASEYVRIKINSARFETAELIARDFIGCELFRKRIYLNPGANVFRVGIPPTPKPAVLLLTAEIGGRVYGGVLLVE